MSILIKILFSTGYQIFGIKWHLLVEDDTFWLKVTHFGWKWRILIKNDSFWLKMIFLVNNETFWLKKTHVSKNEHNLAGKYQLWQMCLLQSKCVIFNQNISSSTKMCRLQPNCVVFNQRFEWLNNFWLNVYFWKNVVENNFAYFFSKMHLPQKLKNFVVSIIFYEFLFGLIVHTTNMTILRWWLNMLFS